MKSPSELAGEARVGGDGSGRVCLTGDSVTISIKSRIGRERGLRFSLVAKSAQTAFPPDVEVVVTMVVVVVEGGGGMAPATIWSAEVPPLFGRARASTRPCWTDGRSARLPFGPRTQVGTGTVKA